MQGHSVTESRQSLGRIRWYLPLEKPEEPFDEHIGQPELRAMDVVVHRDVPNFDQFFSGCAQPGALLRLAMFDPPPKSGGVSCQPALISMKESDVVEKKRFSYPIFGEQFNVFPRTGEPPMLYLGIDQHARQITISLRDEDGDVVQARQVSTRPDKINELFQHLTRERLTSDMALPLGVDCVTEHPKW